MMNDPEDAGPHRQNTGDTPPALSPAKPPPGQEEVVPTARLLMQAEGKPSPVHSAPQNPPALTGDR